jgi:hypothetical protein
VEHTIEELAPTTELKKPKAHAVHTGAPEVRSLYVPAEHAVHAVVPDATALYAPAPHAVQTADVLAPAKVP